MLSGAARAGAAQCPWNRVILMMARCVVVVDAAYVRAAMGRLLADDDLAQAVVQDAQALFETIRDLAVGATEQDLLRVYWYEAVGTTPPDDEALRLLPYLSARTPVYAGLLDDVQSPMRRDLLPLLRNGSCGDLIVCTDDESLAPLMAAAQESGRHVHWLQVPDDDEFLAALHDASDTRLYWSQASARACFRVATDREALRLEPVDPPEPVESVAPVSPRVAPPAEAPTASTARPRAAMFDSASWERDPFGPPADMPERGAHDGATRTPRRTPTSLTREPRSMSVQRADRSANAPLGTVLRTEAELRDVAEQVAETIEPQTDETVRRWARGIPADIDRQLLATSLSVFGTLLSQPEKHTIRRLFVEACTRRALTAAVPNATEEAADAGW